MDFNPVANQDGFVPTRCLDSSVPASIRSPYQQQRNSSPILPLPHHPQSILRNDLNRATNATSLTPPAQPVQLIEMIHNHPAAVPHSSPTHEHDIFRRCAITGNVIVKCAHLRNEPGVFYECDRLIDVVTGTGLSPHSFLPVSLGVGLLSCVQSRWQCPVQCPVSYLGAEGVHKTGQWVKSKSLQQNDSKRQGKVFCGQIRDMSAD
ncbi:hypothetical protein BLNAU_12452 [Blattamonas nauphoetae]|uniref:Uncharacterized protein n=1 Tax=Blattamonas nauphoetae TaxID=2049346 RepID=A0ABQ9XLJ9_9EUKA|nr:hypothetical protein BLNAU_12452 [Blattamonas nauphoetae]